MRESVNSVLKKAIEKAKPSREELLEINSAMKAFVENVKRKIKKLGIDAEVFVGGSFAKKTMMRKKSHDIDVFIRFDKKYEDSKISNMAEKILADFGKTRVHGSRDYFEIKHGKNALFEVIPVRKISKPKDAENVTDMSYSHVRYIRKKAKSEKTLDEIVLAKTFCYANGCYGAESHISGFSGYSLELLIIHYKSFLKFIKEFSKIKEKTVIDIEKHFRNKNEVMINLNESKLKSPVILIDPTNKQRNALAALSKETFLKFQKLCKDFLKNPSGKFFEMKGTNIEALKKEAERKKLEFVLIKAKTSKQKGAIAGSKLLKFHNHLKNEISRFFDVRKSEFIYGNGDSADYFFSAKKKMEILIVGPALRQEENVRAFKMKHKGTFAKAGRIYAKEKVDFGLKDFFENWKKKNKERMREMSIKEMEIS